MRARGPPGYDSGHQQEDRDDREDGAECGDNSVRASDREGAQQMLAVGAGVQAELVSRAPTDPVGALRATTGRCKEFLGAVVDRDEHLARGVAPRGERYRGG